LLNADEGIARRDRPDRPIGYLPEAKPGEACMPALQLIFLYRFHATQEDLIDPF
jgi:hypothetical protein